LKKEEINLLGNNVWSFGLSGGPGRRSQMLKYEGKKVGFEDVKNTRAAEFSPSIWFTGKYNLA